MTENQRKPRKWLARRLIVLAAALAMAFALAMGANAATNGELLESLGRLVATFHLEGREVNIYQAEETDGGTRYSIEVDNADKTEIILREGAGYSAETESGASEDAGKTTVALQIDEDSGLTLYRNGEKVEPESSAPAESAAP